MPTPNDRTVPSPERDEIEAKIHELYNSGDTFRGMLEKIAAFSARRAREKAIEECYEIVSRFIQNDLLKGNGCLTMRQLIQELKSPTN